jgi:hypothetical protein
MAMASSSFGAVAPISGTLSRRVAGGRASILFVVAGTLLHRVNLSPARGFDAIYDACPTRIVQLGLRTVVILVIVVGWIMLVWVPVGAAIGWARVILRDHSLLQGVAGSAVGATVAAGQ